MFWSSGSTERLFAGFKTIKKTKKKQLACEGELWADLNGVWKKMDRIIMTQYWILQRWCGYNESLLFLFTSTFHDDVIQWKHFPRYWPFVRGNHQSPLDTHHKVQWLGALMFSLICAWRNGWANNRDAGDVRGHRAHYGATNAFPERESNHYLDQQRWHSSPRFLGHGWLVASPVPCAFQNLVVID